MVYIPLRKQRHPGGSSPFPPGATEHLSHRTFVLIREAGGTRRPIPLAQRRPALSSPAHILQTIAIALESRTFAFVRYVRIPMQQKTPVIALALALAAAVAFVVRQLRTEHPHRLGTGEKQRILACSHPGAPSHHSSIPGSCARSDALTAAPPESRLPNSSDPPSFSHSTAQILRPRPKCAKSSSPKPHPASSRQ